MTAPESVDAYLATVPEDKRAALEDLRATIRGAAPEATEEISYGMPGFRHHGGLVTYAAFKNHCSLFPMSTAVIDAHRDELAPFRTSKGTLQFSPERPLPTALVESIVRARVAENEARRRR